MANFEDIWNTPPASVQLSPDEIHLWRVDLDSIRGTQNPDETPLSRDETVRAARFHFERDRRSFRETRIALRTILGQYLCINPDVVRFEYCQNGKPEISASQNDKRIRFNVSHSGRFSIIGVSLERPIGVDVEKYRTMEFLQIAERYFSEYEFGELKAICAKDLPQHFFSCWTKKEAVLKGLGEGVGHLLDRVSIPLSGDSPNRIVFQDNPDMLRKWVVFTINLHPDYAAAAAFEGTRSATRYWEFRSLGRRV